MYILNKIWRVLLFVFFLQVCSFFTVTAQNEFRILPQPQKVEWGKGRGIDWFAIKALYLNNTKRPPLGYPLNNLSMAAKPGLNVLSLIVSNENNLPESEEGYILEIKAGEVIIKGRSEKGVFYGCQTLLQLIEDARDQGVHIPACKITDYPNIAYRAFHLDIKYHLDNMQYYYQMIDRLAAIKVNAVMVEFEDKLRYRKAPVVGSGNAISMDEFAALTRYAKERHVEISPLVQGLGHVSFILKHDQYHYLRDDKKIDWVFDPLHPDTYELQFKLYDDAIEATPGSRYLHVGGDEVYNLGRSELSRQSGMKPFELQMYWLNKVCEYARKHNRTPVFWDDMIFNLAEVYMSMHDRTASADSINNIWKKKIPDLDKYLHLFPKDCIYMRWHYSYPKLQGNQNALQWFNDRGLKVMGASAVQDMEAMMPRKKSLFQPIKEFSELASKFQLLGMLATAWDDSSPHIETYWRGIYDFASLGWNYTDIDDKEAHRIFRHRFFSPALVADKYEFQDSLETALGFWDNALLKNGGRMHYPYTPDFISLPVKDSSGIWSKQYATKIERAITEIQRYGNTKNILSKNEKLARRNFYNLQLMSAINELQVYPSQLLLLLHQYDNAGMADEVKYKAAIRKQVEAFSTYRRNYEAVLSQTRFLFNPPGYILDQNNDTMLANGTNNSDWMHIMEIGFNDTILKWLDKHE